MAAGDARDIAFKEAAAVMVEHFPESTGPEELARAAARLVFESLRRLEVSDRGIAVSVMRRRRNSGAWTVMTHIRGRGRRAV